VTTTDTVPSSQDLLRAALRRSAERGRQVARRRLIWRWCQWVLLKLLLWVLLPGLAALGAWSWWVRHPQAPAPASALPTAASAPAPWNLPPASDNDLRELQLRLDDALPASSPPLTPRRNP
jgi:hypothetical protein